MAKENYSGPNGWMPDADYFKMLAQSTWAWNHRMELDPLEGFEESFSPASETGDQNSKDTPIAEN